VGKANVFGGSTSAAGPGARLPEQGHRHTIACRGRVLKSDVDARWPVASREEAGALMARGE